MYNYLVPGLPELFKCSLTFNLVFFRVLEYRNLRDKGNYFHKKVKKYESFSVTIKYVDRINSCIGQEIQIVRQILKDMRNVLIMVFLCFGLRLSGATYYVSPGGSDSNPGTITQPFFTLNKAWSVVSAGDMIYMRGGTYNYSSQQTISGKSGSSGNYITISAYSTEKPVMDFSGNGDMGMKSGLRLENINYVYFKGLRIMNAKQPTNPQNGVYGVLLRSSVNHCTFEQVESDHNGGWGFAMFDNISDILFLNCDSHHNSDPYSANQSGGGVPYGGSDGWQCGTQTVTSITFRGCRSFSNSDDGWDLRMSVGDYTFENCWSFWNGYVPETITTPANRSSWTRGGDGEALKVGGNGGHRIVKNCLMFENRLGGIENSDDGGGYVTQEVYNTIAYKSQMGFNYQYNHPATLRNNISYQNDYNWETGSGVTDDHNSWNGGATVTDADFQSVNSVGMDGPRQSDGSLPVLSFLRPASGSKLIDAGINVGMPFSGNSPDLGAFEVVTGSTITLPVYTSAAVQNATPSLLEMTYNIALANIVPVASAFSVKVNSVARPVSSVVISGTKVQLTLASPVVTGDVITVSYTIPASNPIQTTSGGQAASITAQTVTNSVNAVNPVYVSSAVANSTPTILEMTFNMTLANIAPSISSFTVLVNSVVGTVSSVAVSGTKVNLTLANRIVAGDVVTVSYTKPATNPIQTTSNGTAASISKQQVLNNCINSAPTAIITSPLTNSSFSTSANITVTASAIDIDGSVTLVEFYNGSTKLGSKSSAPYTLTMNNVTAGNYSLTVTATDNLNAKTTSSSISISVVDAAHKPNQHPIVKILNPTKGIKFDKLSPVTIDAIASDPDGTISKVEFYNGSVKLVELTSAPYTYTWKDVLAGNYSIIAIATDNLNDTTVSSPVEFEIGSTVKYDVNSEIVKLYPNPNNGHFSVEFLNPLQNDKSEIIITDLTGKQVYNGQVLKEEKLKKIDVSGSRSGMYVMMIKKNEILVTKKFIIN
jgi:uncharacterized repeat protein (TIGR02059 family)